MVFKYKSIVLPILEGKLKGEAVMKSYINDLKNLLYKLDNANFFLKQADLAIGKQKKLRT